LTFLDGAVGFAEGVLSFAEGSQLSAKKSDPVVQVQYVAIEFILGELMPCFSAG
jgi:hypothetical protein